MVPMKELLFVAVLFVVLSPGVVLHLPLADSDGNYLAFNSGHTSLLSVVFHAAVFTLLYAGVRQYVL
uniref:Uncharacterized protein n=1 Tax=viral metagenome TaxID=1070528 RepID=A0A6C0F5J5_9ZZZZ|tara:strand:+ start:782 stop:982 length:201 start_codon:yes stop_codon:yes gene_type:complete